MSTPMPLAAPLLGARLPRRTAALIDQGLVSGANFLAFVALARVLGPADWGTFAFAYAIVLFLQGVQRAMVTIPMVPFTAGGAGWGPARAAWAGANMGLAGGGLLLLLLAAGAAGLMRATWLATSLLMAAVLLVPACVMEFGRRAAVLEQRFGLLAAMGLAYAAVLLLCAWVPASGLLQGAFNSAWLPTLAMALAMVAAAATYRMGSGLAVWARPARPPNLAGYGSFSAWAVAGHLGYSGYNFGVQALLAAVAGPAAVGVFHACRTLVQPVSTLQAAMDSIDKPRAAAALAQGGPSALRHVLLRSGAGVALLSLPFLALVALGAAPLLQLAYGAAYAGQHGVVLMACAVALCSVLSQPVETGLYVAKRTRALFMARAVAALASLACALPWTVAHGATGALAAMALGFGLAAVLGGVALWRLPKHAPADVPASPAPARRSVYLAWTTFQRRQLSMADSAGFDCVFLPLSYKGRSHTMRLLHYALLFGRTLRLLVRRRPPTVWLQLPQMPLLWAALTYRLLFDRRVRLVADCHNAVFKPPWSRVPLGLSQLRRCDAVLVHNQDVLTQALALGVPAGRLRVLEDVPPLRDPALALPPVPALFAGQPRPWVLFVGSYGADEPVAEVLQAARALPGVVAVTGRLGNARRNGHDIGNLPGNVVLTDYLPVADFEALLVHCDVVLALTRFDGIQLSVCNEALGFGRPMVVSDTPLLRRLFGSAGVMVDSAEPDAIARGVLRAWQQSALRAEASRLLAVQRRRQWQDVPLRDCMRLLRSAADGEPGPSP